MVNVNLQVGPMLVMREAAALPQPADWSGSVRRVQVWGHAEGIAAQWLTAHPPDRGDGYEQTSCIVRE